MPVKNYVSRNGQIEYEIDEAGEILTYGRDALGNVVAGYDKNTNAVFTIDYKPFGEFAATTGTITGRRFLWVGTWGYRFTPEVPVSHYIRARHLSMRMGMWTSVDPLWPSEMAYGYVVGSVMSQVDPSGLYRYRIFPLIPCRDKYIKVGPFIQRFECFGFVEPCICIPVPGGRYGRMYPPGSKGVSDIYWYGNYCGANNVVPPCDQELPTKQPIDCIDAACKAHDNCLANCEAGGSTSYSGRCQSKCHCMLAILAEACAHDLCGQTIVDPNGDVGQAVARTIECITAAKTIQGTFNAICLATFFTGFFNE